ncbi:MAG: AraC family transcriptional regulator [Clostridia bacterium]|nr:AraC family transcriptional regulator [Clostridia bacterium]
MSPLRENVAYLQGLVDGSKLDTSKDEGRVIKDIINALSDVADAIENLDDRQTDLESYVDSIDEGLMDLEEDVLDVLDGDFTEVECPDCGEVVCFDSSILDDEDLIEVTCPNCDAVVFVNDYEDCCIHEGCGEDDFCDKDEDD